MTDSDYLEFSEFHMKFPRMKLTNLFFPAACFYQLEEWMKIDVQISVKAKYVPCTAQEKQIRDLIVCYYNSLFYLGNLKNKIINEIFL